MHSARLPRTTALVACLAALLGTLPARSARAGGFFLFDRGAVGVSRGGAFVAGANDADALHYNPAGLLSAGRQLQLDVAMPRIRASFTRFDPGGNAMPQVDASQAPLPTPTIAYADDFGLRRWAFGAGVFVPSAVVLRWPTSVDWGATTQPAPQRYSLYSMNGTILAAMSAGAAFDAGHGVSFGASLGVNVADFQIDTVVSGCDGLACTNRENTAYDSRVNLDSGLRFAPLATFGARYQHRYFAVGASFTTPHSYRGDLDLHATMPTSPVFDGATFETGDGKSPRVRGDIRFPWVLRAGVEARPTQDLRVEVAYVAEGWSVEKELRFTPQDVSIRLLNGIATFDLIPIVIPRQMRTTHSVRLGGQYHVGRFDVRGGLAYETGAFADRTLSPLTLDSGKTTVSAGGTVHVGDHVLLDLTFAYAIMNDRTVTNSVVYQPTAIAPFNGGPNVVGNGRYAMDAYYVGAGLRWQIRADEPAVAPRSVRPSAASPRGQTPRRTSSRSGR